MKKFRVTFRFSDKGNGSTVKTQEVEADAWRVDSNLVCLYRQDGADEVKVFDVPKARIMRILEV